MRPVVISMALRLSAAQRVKRGLVLKKKTASATKYSPRDSAFGWGAGCVLTLLAYPVDSIGLGLETDADACWGNCHVDQAENHAKNDHEA
jgi:hypothetical protein